MSRIARTCGVVGSGKSRGSGDAHYGQLRGVDGPMLIGGGMTDGVVQASDIHCAELLDKDSCGGVLRAVVRATERVRRWILWPAPGALEGRALELATADPATRGANGTRTRDLCHAMAAL